jgi:hypothetical protein
MNSGSFLTIVHLSCSTVSPSLWQIYTPPLSYFATMLKLESKRYKPATLPTPSNNKITNEKHKEIESNIYIIYSQCGKCGKCYPLLTPKDKHSLLPWSAHALQEKPVDRHTVGLWHYKTNYLSTQILSSLIFSFKRTSALKCNFPWDDLAKIRNI